MTDTEILFRWLCPTPVAFIAGHTGILLCGECYVDGCSKVEMPDGFTCEACGHEVPLRWEPPRPKGLKALASRLLGTPLDTSYFRQAVASDETIKPFSETECALVTRVHDAYVVSDAPDDDGSCGQCSYEYDETAVACRTCGAECGHRMCCQRKHDGSGPCPEIPDCPCRTHS